jgi:hypothetical protein
MNRQVTIGHFPTAIRSGTSRIGCNSVNHFIATPLFISNYENIQDIQAQNFNRDVTGSMNV